MDNAILVAALLVIGILLVVVWVRYLVQVMALEDDDFPGRNDKALWLVVFLVAPLLAPFVFLLWKKTMLAMSRQKRGGSTSGR